MSSGKWDDLVARVASGVAMVLIGAVGVWAGGLTFHLLISVVCGLMVWELVRMLDPGRAQTPLILGAFTCVCLFIASYMGPFFALPLLLLPSIVGLAPSISGVEHNKPTFTIFTALILIAGYGLIGMRDDFGIVWIGWLLLVVIVTDIAGYFVGRAIGGPKLWPRVSPKKTWSGSAGGWVGAAVVGLIFALFTQAGFGLTVVSVAVSMASQIGDVAESAIKRRAGVKDSSHLIPGHGGLLDRFDGMLGAALLVVVAGLFTGFPPGAQ